MFWDLNVPYNRATMHSVLHSAIQSGYDGIAWNTVVTADKLENTYEYKCLRQPVALDDASISGVQNYLLKLKAEGKEFQQRFRLTVKANSFKDLAPLNNPNSPLINSYDIVAVEPSDEKIFHQCCERGEIDIITFDMTRKTPFKLRAPSVRMALKRGIRFELKYGPALRNDKFKQYFLHNGMNLVNRTRGRNIIISSGAEGMMDMRGPYDAINLAVMMGLDQGRSRSTVSAECMSVFFTAQTRRTFKGMITAVENVQVDKEKGGQTESQGASGMSM